ncbi:MAG TPA: hypothetical protein GX507_08835 [Clostridia bacterium]|nr:hypothetical protein [Clostridia bacterium]
MGAVNVAVSVVDRWFGKDAAVKALSVLIAVVLWFQVVVEENPPIQKTFDRVSVSVENLPPGYVLVDWWPKTVRVVVKSPQRAMAGVEPGDISATVDIKDATSGQYTKAIEVSVPKGLEIVETVPSIATVVLDQVLEKQVPVQVKVEGLPSSEYQAGSPQVQPAQVTLKGPKGQVSLVERVIGRLDISGARGDLSRMVRLEPVTADGKKVDGVTVLPAEATVSLAMTKLPPSGTFEVVPEIKGSSAPGYRVDAVWAEPSTVTVRAQEDVLRTIGGRLKTEPVSVEGLGEGVSRYRAKVVSSPQFFSLEPSYVTVWVRIVEDKVSKRLEDLPVIITGVRPGLKWDIEPGAVSVTLEGKRGDLDAFGPEALRVTVDARGLEEGVHRLPVSVDTGSVEGVEVKEINPTEVTVTLTPRNS